MVVNIYYLIVGVLSILFSFTHALNGQRTILKFVDSSNIDAVSQTTIFYVWHIVTIENLIFGICFIAMALYKKPSRVKSTAWLIAMIIVARWCLIFGSTLARNRNGLAGTLVDSIAIIVFVTLIILGIRKGEAIQAHSGS
jgi:hypothetical protein